MGTREQKETRRDGKKWLLLLLVLLLIVTIGITIWALFFRSAPVLKPDYAPRKAEQYAQDTPARAMASLPVSRLCWRTAARAASWSSSTSCC